MGYVSKDIAVISEPKILTLASLPNFITFASKPHTPTYYEFNIQINASTSLNLLNPNTVTDGYYVDPGTGNITAIAGYGASDFINVKSNTQYTGTSNHGNTFRTVAFYDASKVRISGINTSINTFTTPAGTAYVRVSLYGPAHPSTPQAYDQQGVFEGTDPVFTPWTGITDDDIEEHSLLRITIPDGTLYNFQGTTNPVDVGGAVFYVSGDKANTAENLRLALLNNSWIAANFDVRVPFTWIGVTPINGRVVNLKSKGAGADYNIIIEAPNNAGNLAYTLTPVNDNSSNGDSITGEASATEIELDVYTDPAVFLGQDDRPVSNDQIGTFAISLQKTYAGLPLWFELNSVFQHFAGYSIPPSAPGWFDTGTVRAYRFVAKVKAVDSYAFYQSSALFVINGYGKASDPINLEDYTYGKGVFKLLTNKPRTTYVRGQKEFINFIYSDAQRGTDQAVTFDLRVSYRVYSSGNTYLGTVYGQSRNSASLGIVNTCVLDIDAVIDTYPKAGIIRIALARGSALLSQEIEYEVRPECLHKLTQFIFLNRLGGWDAFNFDAKPEGEIKPDIQTFSKVITPSYTKATGLETVYATNLEDAITIDGAPVTAAVAQWLKELAAARVVLDGDGNYVVIEDFKVKPSDTDNMQTPTIKYHLSETFTND